MSLVWADQCRGAAGSPPDPTLWGRRVTDAWQPRDELQTYTQSLANAFYDGNGALILRAIQAPTGGVSSAKLSARHSTDPALFRFGLFEARIKVPAGIGIWPAWWLLGEDNLYGWPKCGEIDVMEAPAIATTGQQIHQGTHSPNTADGSDVKAGVPPVQGLWNTDYHTYAVDWRRGCLEFHVDDKFTGGVSRATVEAAGGSWVFDHRPQSLVLNLAVGGWAGAPVGWTTQTMSIKHVRVYD